MKGKLLILTTALFVLSLAIWVSTALAANWITTCSMSHESMDDPIVYPGKPGASHHHTFLGATTTNAFSTFNSLVHSPTTCQTSGDSSGYWFPTANYPVHDRGGLLIYYSVSSSTPPFPDGLKMIVRWTGGHILFKCGPGSNTETPAPPHSCSSGMLVAVIEFPQWWDGHSLDSADHLSHMSYSHDAGHPVELPRQKWYLRLAVPSGAPINLQLSSGNYTTFHVDFFDGWNRAALQHLISQCGSHMCGTNP